MFMKLKTEGVKSTAGATVKKGGKGRVEFFVERDGDGFTFGFKDFGNYGRERWSADAPASELEIRAMIAQLQEVLAGTTDSTRYTEEELEAAFLANQGEPPTEEADAEEEFPPTSEPVEDIDQLEA